MPIQTFRLDQITRVIVFIVGFVFCAFNTTVPTQASPRPSTEESRLASTTAEFLLAQLCVRRIGDYVSHDHAIRARNEIVKRGYHAWIEHHGSIISRSRTYVVLRNYPVKKAIEH